MYEHRIQEHALNTRTTPTNQIVQIKVGKKATRSLLAHCEEECSMRFNKVHAEMQATASQLLISDGLANPRVCDLFSTW